MHVRPCRHAGEPDERDRLAADNAIADPNERRGRVIRAGHDAARVTDANPPSTDGDPADRRDHPVIGRDDERAERCRDIDAGVSQRHDLGDRANARDRGKRRTDQRRFPY